MAGARGGEGAAGLELMAPVRAARARMQSVGVGGETRPVVCASKVMWRVFVLGKR